MSRIVKFLKILFLFLFSNLLTAQNLILNPSFEQLWVCPHSFIADPVSKPYPEWLNPNNSTPDIFSFCSDFNAGVPENFAGYLFPRHGNSYAGMVLWEKHFTETKNYNVNSREYLQTKFITPLKRNKLYCIHFYFANAKKTMYSIDGLGVAITKNQIKSHRRGTLILQRPQLFNKPGNILNDTDWIEFSGVYRAKGGENFFTIGNFFDNSTTTVELNKRENLDSTLVYAYYLIDDINVFEVETAYECDCQNKNIYSYDPFADDFDKKLGYNTNHGIAEDNFYSNNNNNQNNNNINNSVSVNYDENNNTISQNNNNIQNTDDNNNVQNPLFIATSQISETNFNNAKVGDKFLLNRIFFEFNSSELLGISYFELDNLFEILDKSTSIKIEIRGHTDNVGTETYNKKLSISRAESVYNYLLEKGISKNRMKYRGFGTTIPLADNTTEEGRRQNRRVEVLIMEK